MKFTKIFLFTLLAIFSLSFIANTTNVAQATEVKGIVVVTVPDTVEHTITFNNNGGSGSISDQKIIEGESANLTSNTFTKTSNTFDGWNTKSDGTGTSYVNGASYTMGDANVTLYAKWKTIPHTVTFDSNGGTGTMSAQTINEGTASNLTSNTFTKAGYGFSGWNTKSDGTGTSYVNGASYTMGTANVILYAKWTAGDSCGTGNGTTPRLIEPTQSTTDKACSVGTLDSSNPADITTNGSQTWKWSCGTVTTTCSAPKFGCRTTNDINYTLSQYGASGPNNVYGCADKCSVTTDTKYNTAPCSGICTNGDTNYPTCTTTTTATCSDGIKNQNETGIDIGGDCGTCSDNIKNGNETGIDTGGRCVVAATCSDGIKNQNETGIDIGGACGTCSDNIKNGNETGIDTGGRCVVAGTWSYPNPCPTKCGKTSSTQTQTCSVAGTCSGTAGTRTCDATGTCATCTDGIKNQDETSIDIGGACATGNLTISPAFCTIADNASTCTVNATWTTSKTTSPVALVDANVNSTLSSLVNNSTALKVWVAFPTTRFELRDNTRTLSSVMILAMCASGTGWDFMNKICKNKNGPSCSDGIKNQDETSIDIGGVCATGNLTISPGTCIIAENASTCTTTGATWTTSKATTPISLVDANVNSNLSSLANNNTALKVWVAYPQTVFKLNDNTKTLDTVTVTSSCASGTSWDTTSKTCKVTVTATCSDGIKNQDETSIDIGGVCATGNLTISPGTCIIAENASTCTTTGATWTTSKATTPISLVDANVNSNLSSLANNNTALKVWVAYPQTVFKLNDNTKTLDTVTVTSSCKSGTSWDSVSDTCKAGTITATCTDGIKNQDETSIDTGGVCDVGPGIDPIVADCKVVSDTTNIVKSTGLNAVAAWAEHPNWTASIPGATWIWRTFKVEHPESDEIVIFTKTFYLNSTNNITNAQIITAADNTYAVSINGTQIINQQGERNNLNANMREKFIKSNLKEGANTLSFVVKNLKQTAGGPSSPEDNPAGLLYRVSITDSSGVNNNCNSGVKVDGKWSDWSPSLTYCPTVPFPQTRIYIPAQNGGDDSLKNEPSSRTVNPSDCPTVNMTVTRDGAEVTNMIPYNGKVNVNWTSSKATSCSCVSKDISNKIGACDAIPSINPTTPYISPALKKQTTYTVSCTGAYGISISDEVKVLVADINAGYIEK